MSYPAQFNTAGRIHTVKEAVEFPFTGKENNCELFLFMLDLYDVLLDIASSSQFPTGRETWTPALLQKLYIKMRKILVNQYDKMFIFIPGRLKGWTNGLFWYVQMMLIKYLQITSPNMLRVPAQIVTWVKENHLQATDSFNLNSWSFMDTCRALEIIEANMDVLEWDETLFQYLDFIEMRAAQLVTLNSNFSILDRAQYRIQVSKTVYQLHPAGIHELMSRTTLIRRKAELWFLWDAVKPLEIQEHYMDDFIEKEQRQMTQRKFRDELANRINENMLRPAERDVQSYRLKGADVSDYAAMASNRPLAMLDAIAKQCSYGKFADLMGDQRVPDAMYVGMVQMHLASVYNMSFTKYFLLTEKNIHKHKHKVHLVLAPFIIQRTNRYDAMWKGNIVPSKDGSFYWAFLQWVMLLRKKCKGIVYGGVNLIPLCQLILDKPKVIAARKAGGTRDYSWD
tara:strand:- start:747 stop:2105 length:1359 start_codon:yes stop_codon:yes gene_type:complete